MSSPKRVNVPLKVARIHPFRHPQWDDQAFQIVHLLALSPLELCVCDIALVLGLGVSALSHQLRFLRERGLCERRRDGRLMYYRLADARLRTLIMDAVTEAAI